mmetsp:Transcript_25651/g.56251  ORF Transcript_25651/g.56251 Transcript_25651/m.56251 type:complete len:106 (-) Transcript_25651:1127-1444(-)
MNNHQSSIINHLTSHTPHPTPHTSHILHAPCHSDIHEESTEREQSARSTTQQKLEFQDGDNYDNFPLHINRFDELCGRIGFGERQSLAGSSILGSVSIQNPRDIH